MWLRYDSEKRNFPTPDRKRQNARLWSIKLFCFRQRMVKINLCQCGFESSWNDCNSVAELNPKYCSLRDKSENEVLMIRVLVLRIVDAERKTVRKSKATSQSPFSLNIMRLLPGEERLEMVTVISDG